jgi:hypothetical protein
MRQLIRQLFASAVPLVAALATGCGGNADTSGVGGAFGAAGSAFVIGGSGGVSGAPAVSASTGGASNTPLQAGGASQTAGGSGQPGTPGVAGASAGGFTSVVSGSGGTLGTAGNVIGAGGSATGGAASVPFSQISALIPSTCGGSLCHTSRQKPYFLNDANLYSTLTNTVVSECGGAHLVVPGNPQGSAIIQLVNRKCSKSGKPFYMPRNCTTNPCLPASQIQTITDWIAGGAPGP